LPIFKDIFTIDYSPIYTEKNTAWLFTHLILHAEKKQVYLFDFTHGYLQKNSLKHIYEGVEKHKKGLKYHTMAECVEAPGINTGQGKTPATKRKT
jgi:hypothetical protein